MPEAPVQPLHYRYITVTLPLHYRYQDWCLGHGVDALAKQRMRAGFALAAVAGTPPAANARLLAFSRRLCGWGSQYVSVTPGFPHAWVATRQARGLSHLVTLP